MKTENQTRATPEETIKYTSATVKDRLWKAYQASMAVDPNSRLSRTKDGGWKIESTCKVHGKFIDFYSEDGRLEAHLRG